MTRNLHVRKKVLEVLYKSYEIDPHNLLSPEEIMEIAQISRDELKRNIFYMEERGWVECLKRFGTSLFAGARILPRGIDIMENSARLARLFPAENLVYQSNGDDLLGIFEELRETCQEVEVDAAALNHYLDSLWNEILAEPVNRKPERIASLCDWLEEDTRHSKVVKGLLDQLRQIVLTKR